ncbi:hypothetical protein QBC39DRAFT_292685 [Podospora conica]|nr:hypothetical protein QBC39DRAFT_292685 [Schizothecium conicum]
MPLRQEPAPPPVPSLASRLTTQRTAKTIFNSIVDTDDVRPRHLQAIIDRNPSPRHAAIAFAEQYPKVEKVARHVRKTLVASGDMVSTKMQARDQHLAFLDDKWGGRSTWLPVEFRLVDVGANFVYLFYTITRLALNLKIPLLSLWQAEPPGLLYKHVHATHPPILNVDTLRNARNELKVLPLRPARDPSPAMSLAETPAPSDHEDAWPELLDQPAFQDPPDEPAFQDPPDEPSTMVADSDSPSSVTPVPNTESVHRLPDPEDRSAGTETLGQTQLGNDDEDSFFMPGSTGSEHYVPSLPDAELGRRAPADENHTHDDLMAPFRTSPLNRLGSDTCFDQGMSDRRHKRRRLTGVELQVNFEEERKLGDHHGQVRFALPDYPGSLDGSDLALETVDEEPELIDRDPKLDKTNHDIALNTGQDKLIGLQDPDVVERCLGELEKDARLSDTTMALAIRAIQGQQQQTALLILDPLWLEVDSSPLPDRIPIKQRSQCNLIAIPLHHRVPEHWALAVVNIEQRYVSCLDSSWDDGRFGKVSRLLQGLLTRQFGHSFAFQKAPCPQQTDGVSCGVYVLSAIHGIATGKPDDGPAQSPRQLRHLLATLVREQVDPKRAGKRRRDGSVDRMAPITDDDQTAGEPQVGGEGSLSAAAGDIDPKRAAPVAGDDETAGESRVGGEGSLSGAVGDLGRRLTALSQSIQERSKALQDAEKHKRCLDRKIAKLTRLVTYYQGCIADVPDDGDASDDDGVHDALSPSAILASTQTSLRLSLGQTSEHLERDKKMLVVREETIAGLRKEISEAQAEVRGASAAFSDIYGCFQQLMGTGEKDG